MTYKLAIAAFAAVFLISATHTIHTIATCDGDAVRGAFTYVCIEDR